MKMKLQVCILRFVQVKMKIHLRLNGGHPLPFGVARIVMMLILLVLLHMATCRCGPSHTVPDLVYGITEYKTLTCLAVEELRETYVHVWNHRPYDFIGAGKVKPHKVLSRDFNHSAWPLKFHDDRYAGEVCPKMHYSYPTIFSAPPEIMNRSGRVEEIKGILYSSNEEVRRRTNTKVIKKLKDVKVSKEEGIACLESSKTFLGELENNTLERFSYKELKKFTSGFTEKVGNGAFGVVYKGQLFDGTKVAVKVLVENLFIEETFEAEVSTVLKISHRRLVKCHGYCSDLTMKALVYEYMENGSLDAILYGNPCKLEWSKFYKIAIKTAKGLSYLHDGCDDRIIHHDVKAANVLLDSNNSPKITDFGLARLMNRNVSHVTWTKLRGTPGYVAPEMCFPWSEITYKCDVYSFGMMLFEVLGMRRIGGDGSQWFPYQVWLKFEKGEVDEIIDECGIHKEKDRGRAKMVCMVALWCAQFAPQARPSMSTVVKMLQGKIQFMEPPNPFLPVSEMFCLEVSTSSSKDNKSVHEKRNEDKGAGSMIAELSSSSKVDNTQRA